jgi:uncharacterized protein (TIGR02246 family)
MYPDLSSDLEPNIQIHLRNTRKVDFTRFDVEILMGRVILIKRYVRLAGVIWQYLQCRMSIQSSGTKRSMNFKNSMWFRTCLALALFFCVSLVFVQAQDSAEKKDESEQQAAESAIRENVERFVTAYNAHDAKAIAELFLPQAQVVDENDNTIHGRADIENLFSGVFEEQPQTGIEVNIESIRFIGTSLALEVGTTLTVPPEGEVQEAGRYHVLHVLRDGKWSMGLVRDVPALPTHRDHLAALAWLVGDWIDEGRAGTVRTSCRWCDNNSFLLQEITVSQPGQEPVTVSQRIGWDPLSRKFKSWVFDSEGGYGESHWTPTETGWLVKSTSVNNDGSTASATNHIEPTGLDRYVYHSVDRVSGDEILPSVRVIVVRQPPQPQESEDQK